MEAPDRPNDGPPAANIGALWSNAERLLSPVFGALPVKRRTRAFDCSDPRANTGSVPAPAGSDAASFTTHRDRPVCRTRERRPQLELAGRLISVSAKGHSAPSSRWRRVALVFSAFPLDRPTAKGVKTPNKSPASTVNLLKSLHGPVAQPDRAAVS
jgi:hypothetical protein